MTERDSEQDDHSDLELSRRRALQLSSGVAVGGRVFGEGVEEASASSENGEDDSELDDDEVEIDGISDQPIDGPTEVIKGVPETYEVNRSEHLTFVWSAENGTVDEDGPEAEVTFHTPGEQEVGVWVAEDGEPDAIGYLDVSVVEITVDGPEEAAVGQRYTFVVPDEPAGVNLGDWSVTPDDAGSFITEGNRVAEVEFEAEVSPATIELEYETDSGYTDTAEHEVEVKQIELSIENVRLVQTVENTRVEDEHGDLEWVPETPPDLDLVQDRDVSVGFNLDGEHIDLLENDVTVVVDRKRQWQDTTRMGTTSVFKDEFELQESRFGSRNDIERFVEAAHGIEELHTLANEYDVDVPVFPLDVSFAELSSVELRIESDVVDSEPVTIERGSDFQVANSRTLRVGFIGLKDPDDGENYGEEDNNGRPHDYEENVEEAIELIEKVYPVDRVVAYRHNEFMEGLTEIGVDLPEWLEETPLPDAVQARDTLEDQIAISESETVNGNGEITEFDATVLVVPHGYFEFHLGSNMNGMVLEDPLSDDVQPQASCLVRDVNTNTMTTPHELAHRFTQALYEGPEWEYIAHPMAQRDSWDVLNQEWDLDFEHARGVDDEDDGRTDPYGVRSVKFDLTDGEYQVNTTAPSLMSYDSGDRWVDSRLFQYLIEHGFEPSPPETDTWDWLATASTDAERTDVISGVATIEEEGTATVNYVHRRAGKPMASAADGNVTLTLRSADGEDLGTVTTVDEWVGVAEENTPIPGTVPFVVPYPKDIEVIVFDHEGTTSTVDPRGRLLASARDRIAEESFIENPEDRLPSLKDKLESVDGQLQNEAYKAAYNKLTNDIRPRVVEWLHDDATVPANYYTKSELLALLDDVIARLEALYDVYDDHPGCGPPDDHPGQGPPEDTPGRGPPEDTPGRGPPDDPPGCDPPDDDPSRGPPDDDDDPGRGPPGDDDPRRGPPGDDDDDDDDDPPGNGPPGDDPPGGGPPGDDDDRGGLDNSSGASTVLDGLKSLDFESVRRYWTRFR